MKNINRKTLIIISLSLFSLNISMAQSLSEWKKIENRVKKDCVNCYANLDGDKKEALYSYSDSKEKVDTTHNKDGYQYTLSSSDTTYKKDLKDKDVAFSDNRYLEEAPINKVDGSKKIAIQVGAFRRYKGAKVYAKKYAILSSKYHVEIVAGAKDQKPIYRVRIEGFSSKTKAKEFKRKYRLTGAFLVMK